MKYLSSVSLAWMRQYYQVCSFFCVQVIPLTLFHFLFDFQSVSHCEYTIFVKCHGRCNFAHSHFAIQSVRFRLHVFVYEYVHVQCSVYFVLFVRGFKWTSQTYYLKIDNKLLLLAHSKENEEIATTAYSCRMFIPEERRKLFFVPSLSFYLSRIYIYIYIEFIEAVNE